MCSKLVMLYARFLLVTILAITLSIGAACGVELQTLQSGAASSSSSGPGSFPVSISVDALTVRGELMPIWRFFGADEPNYGTMKNGRKLLAELGRLAPREVYFRA